MKITELIVELAGREGGTRAKDLYEHGYSGSQVERALKRLVDRKAIFKRGHAKLTYYTTDSTAPELPVAVRGQKVWEGTKRPPMPDLPENILLMMGYTKTPVDMRYARQEGHW